MPYQSYLAYVIIRPLGLERSGFHRTDALPPNTALGYVGDAASGPLRTNIFCVPVLGGSDGGLYTCAGDLDLLWRALFAGRVLSESMLQAFLKPWATRGEGKSYGLGVYRYESGGDIAYYAVGGDFGVDFFTAYFPRQMISASALGNTEVNTYPLLKAMFSAMMG